MKNCILLSFLTILLIGIIGCFDSLENKYSNDSLKFQDYHTVMKDHAIFEGEGESWKVTFKIKSKKTTLKEKNETTNHNDKEWSLISFTTVYKKESSDLKNIESLNYWYSWLHKEAKYTTDKNGIKRVVFEKSDDEYTSPSFISGGSDIPIMFNNDSPVEKEFSDVYSRGAINISDRKNIMQITVRWNDYEEVINVKKVM